MSGFLSKILGSRNQRILKNYNKIVKQINSIENSFISLSDIELKNKTLEFKNKIREGQNLDSILVEAFALVREGIKRIYGKRLYDVQLLGGITLHKGKIAEMRTGEGKTFTAILPAYLNALTGNSVHIITVNEYLAQRDANKMSELFTFLGLTTACNHSQLTPEEKKVVYNADIIYGTNSEFGFDYLRDNMALSLEDKFQKTLNYAIIDEVDSILIDEARTPLIISGASQELTNLYSIIKDIPPQLQAGTGSPEDKDYQENGDYAIDLKNHKIVMTEEGHEKVENIMKEMGLLAEGGSLYDSSNISLVHHLNAALKAHALFHLNQHYVIKDDKVVIVDELTGRLMEGRRWNDGIHQAIEAKENLTIQDETVTAATITLQNYFRLYKKLSGMTGTADTEAFEFQDIYNLETIVIPTNKPVQRQDNLDEVYLTKEIKDKAILADIEYCHKRGQPVLIGTSSIENNEYYSQLLTKHNLPHQVLNAKQHLQESYIVSQAGKLGMITLATNMAGRGTDIILGGNIEQDIINIKNDESLTDTEKEKKIQELNESWEQEHQKVIELGGLHIIGTERNESRRIDNQFRGRSGRQGDPGSSRFYLSLEDPLLTIFSGERVAGALRKLQMHPEQAIMHPFMSKSLERAQKKLENHNFNIRKQLLDYDNVANEQRNAIYNRRNEILAENNVEEYIDYIFRTVINNLVDTYVPPMSSPELWNLKDLEKSLSSDFNFKIEIQYFKDKDNTNENDIKEYLYSQIKEYYKERSSWLSEEELRKIEKVQLLQSLDSCWGDNLSSLDYLRQGIALRSYAQKDPKLEYKKEAFKNFENFVASMQFETMQKLLNLSPLQDLENINKQEEKLD